MSKKELDLDFSDEVSKKAPQPVKEVAKETSSKKRKTPKKDDKKSEIWITTDNGSWSLADVPPAEFRAWMQNALFLEEKDTPSVEDMDDYTFRVKCFKYAVHYHAEVYKVGNMVRTAAGMTPSKPALH